MTKNVPWWYFLKEKTVHWQGEV